jgi:hypothetical protein
MIDEILALAGAIQSPGNGDFRTVGELRGKRAVPVLEDQGYLCHAHGFASVGAAEDHIFHLSASQDLGALFAHSPADRIHQVALSAAIWPHNRAQSQGEWDLHPVCKGFEAGDGKFLYLHARLLIRTEQLLISLADPLAHVKKEYQMLYELFLSINMLYYFG